MVVTLKISDELYEAYAKRNPASPRAAMVEALETFQGLEPGVPRLVVENPTLRELKALSQQQLNTPEELLSWAKKHAAASVDGLEIPLSLGQRQRLIAQAEFLKQPFEKFAKDQLAVGIQKAVGV